MAVGAVGAIARVMLLAAGVLCALAGVPQLGLSHMTSSAIGVAIGLAAIGLLRGQPRSEPV